MKNMILKSLVLCSISISLVAADENEIHSRFNVALRVASVDTGLELIKYILDHGGDVNAVDRDGDTALASIAGSDYWRTAELLINNGADIDRMNKYKQTPLLISLLDDFPNESLIELLLDHDANVNVQEDEHGYTPLMLMSISEYAYGEIAKEILQLSTKETIDLKDHKGRTALLYALDVGYPEFAKLLLDRGATEGGAFNRDGNTPLILAVLGGYQDIVKLLLARDGTNIDAANAAGDTALTIAARNGNAAIVELLLEAATRGSSEYGPPLEDAPLFGARSSQKRDRSE